MWRRKPEVADPPQPDTWEPVVSDRGTFWMAGRFNRAKHWFVYAEERCDERWQAAALAIILATNQNRHEADLRAASPRSDEWVPA